MLVWNIVSDSFPFVIGSDRDVHLLVVAAFSAVKQRQGASCDETRLDTNVGQYAFGYHIVGIVKCRYGDFQFVVASVVWECEYLVCLFGIISHFDNVFLEGLASRYSVCLLFTLPAFVVASKLDEPPV